MEEKGTYHIYKINNFNHCDFKLFYYSVLTQYFMTGIFQIFLFL